MPSGDAQRAWFPEMLVRLKSKWKPDLSWKKQISICEEMTRFREQIWNKQGIKPAKTWCSNCKNYHESRPQSITIRSMLFALKKIGVISDAEFKKIDKSWKKYRKEHELDACGKNA